MANFSNFARATGSGHPTRRRASSRLSSGLSAARNNSFQPIRPQQPSGALVVVKLFITIILIRISEANNAIWNHKARDWGFARISSGERSGICIGNRDEALEFVRRCWRHLWASKPSSLSETCSILIPNSREKELEFRRCKGEGGNKASQGD